jgi:two-component system cell cycle response regulator
MSGRILIVDDMASNRIVTQARLAAAFYDPVLASDGESCLRLARAGMDARPDLILLALNLADLPGPVVLRRLRADPRSRDIPVIAIAPANAPELRLAAFAAGADDVISRSAGNGILLARLRNLLRARMEQGADPGFPVPGLAEQLAIFDPGGTVALVAATPESAAPLQDALAAQGCDRLVVLTRSEALAESGTALADVFVLQESGCGAPAALRLLSDLKSRLATRHAAVCLLDSGLAADAVAMAFDLGADDVAGPEVTVAELALRLRGLLRRKNARDRQRDRMQDSLRLALIDPLTGLYNRRHAVPQLRAIAGRAARSGADFAVMVVDLDRFKLVNDRHGHASGDAVLVEVSRRLTATLRDSDLLARIGGEEFLIALPDTGFAEARLVAERLCHAVEYPPMQLPSGVELTVTVSIGVAVSKAALTPVPIGQAVLIDAVVEQADLALLDAKNGGRNQVTFRQIAA